MGTCHENHLGVQTHTSRNIWTENYDTCILFEVFIHIFYSVSIIKCVHITYICNMKIRTTQMLQNVIDESGFYISYGLSSPSTYLQLTHCQSQPQNILMFDVLTHWGIFFLWSFRWKPPLPDTSHLSIGLEEIISHSAVDG